MKTLKANILITLPSYSNLTKDEIQWLEALEEIIIQNSNEVNFNMTFLGDKMGLSRRQVQRRIKAMLDMTPKKFINELRFLEARRLLEMGEVKSVKSVATLLGVSSSGYFSMQFKKRFGKSPSMYLK